MNADKPGDSSGQALPPPNPSEDRRRRSGDVDKREVVFVDTSIGQERLDALKKFLAHASADEIAMVRRVYGENLEVLKLISVEVAERFGAEAAKMETTGNLDAP